MTAMALCSKPDLVVFDEPTTALDVTTQIEVLAAIKEAIAETGVAALYITHDLAVVAQVADNIMVLRHGKMVEYGTTRQIIEAPVQEYTRALVSVRSIEHVEKPEGAAAILSVAGITARYRGTKFDVLTNVTVDLPAGQTLAVVGESGSGKSTLARVITGLLPPAQFIPRPRSRFHAEGGNRPNRVATVRSSSRLIDRHDQGTTSRAWVGAEAGVTEPAAP